jgi:hypothetical protein
VGIDERDIGPGVQDAAAESVRGPRLNVVAAVIDRVAARDGHVREVDADVRSGDLEHAVRHGLVDRGALAGTDEFERLDPASGAVDIEVAVSACDVVTGTRIGLRESVGSTRSEIEDFDRVGGQVVIGRNDVRTQTPCHAVRGVGRRSKDRGTRPLLKLFRIEPSPVLLLASRTEEAFQHLGPVDPRGHGELPVHNLG